MTQVCKLLQDANRKLQFLLNSFVQSGQYDSCATEDLAAVLSEVLRVGEWMGTRGTPEKDPEIARELDTYLKNLHALREMLPDIEARLLTERARLERERAHLQLASAWVHSTRSTC